MRFRYSRWDGSQQLPDLDADELLEAMADDLLFDGDPRSALQRMLRAGHADAAGAAPPGLKDLLERLRQRRQQQLDRYDLGSSLDDIQRKLDQILQTERRGSTVGCRRPVKGRSRGSCPRPR